MASKTKAHVSNAKKLKVKKLIDIFTKYKTLMVVSIKGLPSRQYQDIKKKLRDKAKLDVIKKSLLNKALEDAKISGLEELEKYVNENTALLYSNEDTFFISGILSKEKSPQKAKAGQLAPTDIEVKAGPTDLIPGPDISALSSVGLAPKVEGGKISIMQNKVIVKKGCIINEKTASIMAKLNIIPFEVGIEPVAAFMNSKVYSDIKIDIEKTIKELEEKYSKALAFTVEISYYTNETLDFIIAKAGLNALAIESLITTEKPKELEHQITTTEQPVEATKQNKQSN